MKRLIFLSITIVTTLSSCSDDMKIPMVPQIYHIDPYLQKHIDRFFFEAAQRNVYLKKENLMAILTSDTKFVDEYTQGLLKRKLGQKYMYIYAPSFLSNTERENEILIFHEMGHWMGLHHDDTHNNIMNAHVDDIYLYGVVIDSTKRQIAIDELFKYKRN